MTYNTVIEIKSLLLLELENQTLSDTDIETYIEDANEEMIGLLRRSLEIDTKISSKTTETFYTFFNILEIKKIIMDGEVIDPENYNLVDDNEGVEVENLIRGETIEIFYIPTNYKMLERAICMENIIQRLSPFSGEGINPSYASWREKKKNYLKIIKEKFGTGLYS